MWKDSIKSRIFAYYDMDSREVFQGIIEGDAAAMVALGDFHLDGTRGIVQDVYAAGYWYQAAKKADPEFKAYLKDKKCDPGRSKPMLWFKKNYVSLLDVSLMIWQGLEAPPHGMEAVHVFEHKGRKKCILPEHLEWRPKTPWENK